MEEKGDNGMGKRGERDCIVYRRSEKNEALKESKNIFSCYYFSILSVFKRH
jgi:hypothetical protein